VDKGQKVPRISKDEYASHLRDIIGKLKKAGIKPVLMTEPRWADGAKNGIGEDPNPRLEQYLAECRLVAAETKTPLVDHYSHWSSAQAKGTDIAKWTTDLCHPNPAGHREINILLVPVILKQLDR
jgi:acyl-CoA thioesterase-1